MVGTRATGRNRSYRYYTCFARNRYDKHKCDFTRLDADAVDKAVLEALADFYRTRHDLIGEAVTAARHRHRAAGNDTRTELAAVTAELTKVQQATDRYLTAFETGALDPELLANRLVELRAKTTQLVTRRDQLAADLTNVPSVPEPRVLDEVADYIGDIIIGGDHTQTKALIETLVAQVKILGPDRLVPTFRIPQPENDNGADTADATSAPSGSVRAMTRLVGRAGLEPATNGL
ncbi:zinc ribbon domain-containing protein [Nocardia panacis]|uniref:zinc ribbon domain-containing protein n=1 Tax=Nocardia panacis TaxID=2340916 RepID=UPI00193A365A